MPKRRTAQELGHISVSGVRTFQTCPRKYWYGYILRIKPIQEAFALRKGKSVHLARQKWLQGEDWTEVIRQIEDRRERLQAQAIMEVVTATPLEYRTLELEAEWRARLWKYGAEAVGRVDELIQMNGQLGILELKVRTRRQDIRSLWEDMQIAVYMRATNADFALYQTIYHSNLDIKDGETDEEFEARKAEMKCPERAKQKAAETDEEYIERIKATVSIETHRIERDERVIDKRCEELRAWSVLARRGRKREEYPQNTSACYGGVSARECPFYLACTSDEAPHIMNSMYCERENSETPLDNTADVV
jgi:CRISPR/Cas system-associated exonuclease Cas4 (RecB family)